MKNETRYTTIMTAEIARATEASALELGPLPKTIGMGPMRMKPPLELEPPDPVRAPRMTTANPAKMMRNPSEASLPAFIC
jgi:hypothetical protein